MSSVTGKAENFIESASGCGPFQVMILLLVFAVNMATTSYTIVFMSFGNYNPGWRCADNLTTSYNTSAGVEVERSVDYTVGSCDDYSQCKHVEFDPGTSTIVTEWGLLCDRSWMSSMTISIQMTGMLVFSFLVGQVSDTFGRKKTLYGGLVVCGALQLISALSTSWIMFVVILFFSCGFTTANMIVVYIYISELMTIKWRALIVLFPFWYVGTIVQALASLATKNWRQVQIVGLALHVLCFIPVVWVPESLRWLEVKRMPESFRSVAKKIAKLNKSTRDEIPDLELRDQDNFNGDNLVTESEKSSSEDVVVKKYTIVDIFRHGYALTSICLGVTTMVFSMIFYATIFGTKALYGDFYINLVVINVVAIPVFLLSIPAVNFASRKGITFIFLAICAACIGVATGLLFTPWEGAKSIGSTLLIAVARAVVDCTWAGVYARTGEIFPTVVRGIGVGYISTTARVGGILAPLIIPQEQQHLYVFTIICGALIFLSCLLNIPLPETKGKPLKGDFVLESSAPSSPTPSSCGATDNEVPSIESKNELLA